VAAASAPSKPVDFTRAFRLIRRVFFITAGALLAGVVLLVVSLGIEGSLENNRPDFYLWHRQSAHAPSSCRHAPAVERRSASRKRSSPHRASVVVRPAASSAAVPAAIEV
jgi:hypothetical protein